MVAHLRIAGSQRRCPPQQIERHFLPPQLMSEQTQIVHRINMLGLLRQNLPIELFGGVQPRGLMMLQCKIEGLLDRELGHAVNG